MTLTEIEQLPHGEHLSVVIQEMNINDKTQLQQLAEWWNREGHYFYLHLKTIVHKFNKKLIYADLKLEMEKFLNVVNV